MTKKPYLPRQFFLQKRKTCPRMFAAAQRYIQGPGIINDVVIGIPIGISSFCYLILCSVTAYIRNITLSPNFMKDWISLLFTILLINSIQVIILDLIFVIKVDHTNYLINSGFTFLFYPIFFLFFNFLNERISYQSND